MKKLISVLVLSLFVLANAPLRADEPAMDNGGNASQQAKPAKKHKKRAHKAKKAHKSHKAKKSASGEGASDPAAGSK